MSALEVQERHVTIHHYMGESCGGYRYPYYRVAVVGWAKRGADAEGWRCEHSLREGEIYAHIAHGIADEYAEANGLEVLDFTEYFEDD